VFTKV